MKAISSHRWYSNLVVTTVCHPFPVFRIFNIEILMPDDCSDVYDQYELALCFVGALYALVLAVFLLAKFIQEVLISKVQCFKSTCIKTSFLLDLLYRKIPCI